MKRGRYHTPPNLVRVIEVLAFPSGHCPMSPNRFKSPPYVQRGRGAQQRARYGVGWARAFSMGEALLRDAS